MEKISEIIRRELQSQPDSLRALGERVQVDHTHLSRFINGERGLTLDAVDSICAALGLTIKRVERNGLRG